MIFSPRRGWIGVDLGTHTVKLAQVVRAGGAYALRQTLLIPRESAWSIENPGSSTPYSSAPELATGLSLGTEFRGADVACALPMALYELHHCQLPGAEEPGTRSAVLARIRETLGERLQDREFDYWPAEPAKDAGRGSDSLSVLSVAHTWARQIALDCRTVGLTARVLDGLPWSLCRAIQLSKQGGTNQLVAAVDWGWSQATFCVIGQGVPLFVRGLRDCGYQNLVQAVSQALEISRDDTFRLLSQQGLPPTDSRATDDVQQLLVEIAADSLCGFVDELQRTLAFVQSHRRLAPQQLTLLGGGATLRHGAPYLADRIGLPVVPWRPSCLDQRPPEARPPLELFGPAIALSTLAWEAA